VNNIDDAAIERQFQDEFRALAARVDRFTLSIRPVDAWILLSQLQLALRHPKNTGPSSEAAKQIARRLQSIVAPHGALAAVAERGWDASYDVPQPPEEERHA